MQTSIMEHIKTVDPAYPIPAVIPSKAGHSQTWVSSPEGHKHIVRAFTFLPGVMGENIYEKVNSTVRSELNKNLGRMLALLGRNTRGFFHQKARRVCLWDIQHVTQLRSLLIHVKDEAQRDYFGAWIENFQRNISPVLPALRSQVLMNDFNLANVLVDPLSPSRITGVLDFGDMAHTPLACDLAIGIGSVISLAPNPIQIIIEYLEGYTSVTPLELEEVAVLLDLIEARMVAFLVIASWRITIHPDNVEYILSGSENMWSTLQAFKDIKRSDFLRTILTSTQVNTISPPSPNPSSVLSSLNTVSILPTDDDEDEEKLLARRANALGPVYRLFYDKPLHFVRAKGIWLYDKEGRAYLDCYNNVPHVGHCHPYVAKTLYHQSMALNTHTRYLHQNVVNYAERLTKTLPESCKDLTYCIFSCTGSEANDLALRIARAYTGNEGIICSENAYHGGTLLTSQISPEVETENERAHYQNFDPGHKSIRNLPTYVKTFPPPNTYERHIGRPRAGQTSTDQDDESVDDTTFFLSFIDKAIDNLNQDGHKPAAVIIDPIFSSDGLPSPPPGFLQGVAEKVRASGGIYIADEVQSGMGRTGDALWGFENHGLVPDIITLGKPIGNGHPLAVVITSQRVIQKFADSTQYFNTFGGNPVSCAVGLAVLDVMEKEKLQENSKTVGAYLRQKLEELKEKYECIGDVRGMGLALGIELVEDRKAHKPSETLASKVVNGLARERILLSATGRFSNVLKIRPPIVLSMENVDYFVERLERVLRKEYVIDTTGGSQDK
eukprot:TRINITY_DN6817_c0_g1_i1.p1 TRINITY_DN6817_c0_g1~~TRINITY_DN6817_c0_g1_i1.p1  ORF type:complete len:858 (-),score=159.10 TRINITY_DN6817_c0_g1_i1:17-2356(-)